MRKYVIVIGNFAKLENIGIKLPIIETTNLLPTKDFLLVSNRTNFLFPKKEEEIGITMLLQKYLKKHGEIMLVYNQYEVSSDQVETIEEVCGPRLVETIESDYEDKRSFFQTDFRNLVEVWKESLFKNVFQITFNEFCCLEDVTQDRILEIAKEASLKMAESYLQKNQYDKWVIIIGRPGDHEKSGRKMPDNKFLLDFGRKYNLIPFLYFLMEDCKPNIVIEQKVFRGR